MVFSHDIVYTLKVSKSELLLICKALGGRLREEEMEAARDLDVKIALSRIEFAQKLSKETQTLLANLDKYSEGV